MLRAWIYPLLLMAFPLPAQIFVSPTGADKNPGTATEPVATVSRALELSRSDATGENKHIVLMPGGFFDVSMALTPADSGLKVEAQAAGRATLFGGVTLSGWQPEPGGLWSAPLPSGRTWDPRLLQVNGRFCARARYPAEGTLTHESIFNVPWMSTTGGGWKRKPTAEELTTLRYKAGDLPATLDISNAEITVFHMWDESVAGITAHDPQTRTLRLAPQLGHPPGAFGVQKYCLWNIKEGMTHPGQWYFDRSRQRMVYWPLNGEDMNQATAVVPTQRRIIQVGGAANVTLRNFNVAVTTVPLITGGFAAAAFDGAVQLDRASGATLSGLRIFNVAGQAIKGAHREDSIRVVDCSISNCGAGGVYLSGENNVVSNNLIHAIGLNFPSAMAIHGTGENCRLSHNEIFDTTYSAVGFGGHNLVIENNLISDCMKVLHDGAAIYCFAAKNSVLRNNFAHDILDTGGYGASAYYLDEQSENTVVENNVSLNIVRPAHNHMATNNVIRGNIFVSKQDLHITFPRCSGYQVESNVLYAAGSITFEGVNNVSAWSGNLLFSKTGKIEGTTLKDYATVTNGSGVCGDTIVGDPGFRNVEHLDFRYDSNSPALKLGLPVLDVSAAGRQGRPK
ncbi:MAG TPA: right-handed parallel beta-helix repeat-containing protein [Verrucomicrobiae bacterium]|nr:right-handed parallel beta-helix repeat-containing protein [Verrucomicrobiae bacterium]